MFTVSFKADVKKNMIPNHFRTTSKTKSSEMDEVVGGSGKIYSLMAYFLLIEEKLIIINY